MEQTIFDIQADFCKTMGHPTRLHLLHILREGPMKVGELAQRIRLPPSTVSRQLHALRLGGIVKFKRHGAEIIYELVDAHIGDVCDMIRKLLSDQMGNG